YGRIEKTDYHRHGSHRRKPLPQPVLARLRIYHLPSNEKGPKSVPLRAKFYAMSLDPFEHIDKLLKEIQSSQPNDSEQLEAFRIRFLGSKNQIKPLFALMKEIPNERKKEYVQGLNELKNTAEAKFANVKEQLEAKVLDLKPELDLTAPGEPLHIGSRHPVSIALNK